MAQSNPKRRARRRTYERLLDKIDMRLPFDCWPWLGAKNSNGYGQLRVGRTMRYAHRLALIYIAGQPIPAGMEVDHLCRNRRCCNPDHLELVTHAENVRRGRLARGQA
jgi:hypothetical protein